MYQKKSIILKNHEFAKLKREAFKRDKCQCQICETVFQPYQLHPHHIVPKGRLHLDILENLLTLCYACHRKLHDYDSRFLDTYGVTIEGLIRDHGLRHYLQQED